MQKKAQRRSSKLISLMIAIVLICQTLPLYAFATEEESFYESFTEENSELDAFDGEDIVLYDTNDGNDTTTGSGIVIQGGGTTLYTSLSSAIAAAEDDDVLVITGTVTESTNINITKNITLMAGNSGGTVDSTNKNITCSSGNKLTLGSGESGEDVLRLNMGTRVTNGEILIQDGVIIRSNGKAVELYGSNATGSVHGGEILSDSSVALWMENGAKITEINNGRIRGHESAMELTGLDTEIMTISGGVFSNETNSSDRSCVYVENNAKIGTINGDAHFRASNGSALAILRGGWVNEIRGGVFISEHKSDITYMKGRGITIMAFAEYGDTGIGKISGGSFEGEIGVYAAVYKVNVSARIDEITGGNFDGQYRGLQLDVGAEVEEISGGNFNGVGNGILNVGSIGKISGNPRITATDGTGFHNYYGYNYSHYNYFGGTVKEISGGTFIGADEYGISNWGTIGLISGGAFIGRENAINSENWYNQFYPQKIEKITGGVFGGKTREAIVLSKPVSVEPDLATDVQGMTRYLSGSGSIFNDESLVNYPNGYYMSTLEEAVSGIYDIEWKEIDDTFKYLTRDIAIAYDSNSGTGSMDNEIGEYNETVTIAQNEFTRDNYIFAGWNTAADGQGKSYGAGDAYRLSDDLVLYAQWQRQAYPVEPKTAAYRVEYYKQQTDGTYQMITGDTQFPLYGGIGTTVAAVPKTYEHYHVNKSTSILSGEIIKPTQDNNGLKLLILKIYYDLDTYTVSYNMNGGTGANGIDYSMHTAKYGESVNLKTAPTQNGYNFTGWSDGTNIHQPNAALTILGDITLTAQWTKTGGGGNGGGGNGGGGVKLPETETPVAELEKENHFAYMVGYPRDEIRPLNQITREEVAIIFYRLLTDESRNRIISDNNPFGDMEGHDWSNRAVSTLYRAGVLKGYEDGSFKPSSPITRAEFAAIASRFDKAEEATGMFTDISGHWAENLINSANKRGWIKGYEDGTFRPDNNITRAEAMSMVNNILERKALAENIHPDAKQWIDNPEGTWYYEIVLEATNSHDYVRDKDNNELWVELKANKIWP